MKAISVIKRLQAIVKGHGDIDVEIYDAATARFLPVHEIQPRRDPLPAFRDGDFIGITSSDIGDDDVQLRYDGTPFGKTP